MTYLPIKIYLLYDIPYTPLQVKITKNVIMNKDILHKFNLLLLKTYFQNIT